MTDWNAISEELAKPLDPRHVKPPPRGKYGDYIEGWHAIAEANRIFGHGGWGYVITSLTPTNAAWGKDKDGKPQFQAGYMAIVTVTVGDVTRQDVGHGQGHMPGEGDAHDSAAKEAVTDALKRALRSFGWPFGLALYDKTKEHVQAPPPPEPTAEEKRANAKAWVNGFIDAVNKLTSVDAVKAAADAACQPLAKLKDNHPELHKVATDFVQTKIATLTDMDEFA